GPTTSQRESSAAGLAARAGRQAHHLYKLERWIPSTEHIRFTSWVFRWSSTNWKRITRSSLPRNISWLSAGSLALLPAAPHPTAETAYRPATNRSRPAGEQAPPRVSRADQASSWTPCQLPSALGTPTT